MCHSVGQSPVWPRTQPLQRSSLMTEFIVAAMRRRNLDLKELQSEESQRALLRAASENGVECLLRSELLRQGHWQALPASVKSALERRARREAALELLRRNEIAKIVSELHAVDVPVLILKGAALAHTHYSAPSLRPCRDVDLFIQRDDYKTAATVIASSGYERVRSIESEIHTQRLFVTPANPVVHRIDLHWAISNRPAFASMLSFDECRASAIEVPPLGPAAWGTSQIHSLLLACIHRVAHHGGFNRLIWLYDIRLLVERLSKEQLQEFWYLAREKRLVALCSAAFRETAASVGCSAEVFHDAPTPRRAEPSASYLVGPVSQLRDVMLDVKGTIGLRAKARLLLSHLLPDRLHMRTAYGARGPGSLAAAYCRRALLGVWKSVKRPVIT